MRAASGELPGRVLLSLTDLEATAGWQVLRPGVQLLRLFGRGEGGASAALIRYQPGAAVPEHTHRGHECVVVLSGAQADAGGRYEARSVVVHPPGSRHAVESEPGCLAPVFWEERIEFTGMNEASDGAALPKSSKDTTSPCCRHAAETSPSR